MNSQVSNKKTKKKIGTSSSSKKVNQFFFYILDVGGYHLAKLEENEVQDNIIWQGEYCYQRTWNLEHILRAVERDGKNWMSEVEKKHLDYDITKMNGNNNEESVVGLMGSAIIIPIKKHQITTGIKATVNITR